MIGRHSSMTVGMIHIVAKRKKHDCKPEWDKYQSFAMIMYICSCRTL